VFSGQAGWNSTTAPTGGSWATNANWYDLNSTATGGAPGLSGYNTDTATFGDTAAAVSVTLDGKNPTVSAVTFNTPSDGSYTISQGPANSGTLTLDNGSSSATVTANGGPLGDTQTISAPVVLNSNTNLVASNPQDILALSGPITSGVTSGATGLAITGSGTVSLSGTNSYAGITNVQSGTLSLTGAGALPAGGELHIEDGATVASADGLQTISGNLSINDQGPLNGNQGAPVATLSNLGTNPLTVAVAASTVNWTGTLHVAAGTVNLGADGASTVNLSGTGNLAPTLVIDAAATVNVSGTGDIFTNTASIGGPLTTVSNFTNGLGPNGSSSYGPVYVINPTQHVAVVNKLQRWRLQPHRRHHLCGRVGLVHGRE
jgi:autotransporter-associated beta strand protein